MSAEYIVCDDKEMTWFTVDADSEEEAVQIARSRGYEPYYVAEVSQATNVWHAEAQLGKIEKEHPIPTERESERDLETAEHKFTNQHGEVWYALESEDSETITITGSDIDWEDIIIPIDQNLVRVLGGWAFDFRVEGLGDGLQLINEYEKNWLESVLLVARKKLKMTKG